MVLEHEQSYLPIVQTPLVYDEDGKRQGEDDLETGGSHSSNEIKQTRTAQSDPESPTFRKFEQATNAELFYDLFFVANLTSFTYVHEINDAQSLKQYVGFFCILWFTWYQVSLYDVRFSMDSVVDRVCKAIQFLVMIGLALVGPQFNPGEETNDNDNEHPSYSYFKALTLILMISRMILALQYLQALWFAKAYKKVVLPMLLIVGTYFVAGLIYLGLYWSFNVAAGDDHSYIAWYIVAIAETALATSVSIIWRNLSFVETHLVERMSLLTLIILGEGAIAIAKACQYLVQSDGAFSLAGSSGAYIACAVFCLYFMYMIYFDWLHEELFGTVRQQIWSFLHFPLHLAMVLTVEGFAQNITWHAAVRRSEVFVQDAKGWLAVVNGTMPTQAELDQVALSVNNTAYDVITKQLSVASSFTSTTQGLAYLLQVNQAVIPAICNGTMDQEAAGGAVWYTIGAIYGSIFKIAAFYPPESPADYSELRDALAEPQDFSAHDEQYWKDSAYETINKFNHVFGLTYVYFFISVGMFVILCTVLAAFNRGSKTKVFWVRLVFIAAIGVGLTLLATLKTNQSDIDNFVISPWLLPLVTICLFTIVVINSLRFRVPRQFKKQRQEQRESTSRHESTRLQNGH